MDETEHDSRLAIKIDAMYIADQMDTLKCWVSILRSLITHYPDKEVEDWAVITETLDEKIGELQEQFQIVRRSLYSQE